MVEQKRLLHLAAAIVAFGITCGCAARPAPAPATVEIGVDLPLAGRDGGDGIMALRGIELAIADVNDVNAVNARQRPLRFALVVRDTSRGGYQDPHVDEATDPIFDDVHGVDDIRAFARDAKLLGVVGPFESNVALPEIPIAAHNGLALLSASARDDRLTHVATPSTFFRLCAPDSADAIGAAHAAIGIGATRVYVVDDSRVQEHGETTAFAAELAPTATTVVGRETYGPDLAALLGRIRTSAADTVIYFGPSPTGVLIMRPSAAAVVLAPSRVRFMADSGFLPPAAVAPAGHSAGSDAYTVWPDPDARSSSAPAFEADFRRRFDVAAPPVAAAYYEAATVLMASIDSASAACGCVPARSAVVRALRQYRSEDSVIGSIAFAASGERTTTRMALVRIRGESFTVVKEFSVATPQ